MKKIIIILLGLFLFPMTGMSQNKESYLKSAYALFEKGEYDNAQTVLYVYINHFKGDASDLAYKIQQCKDFMNKADSAIVRQQIKDAIDYYRGVLSINPKDPNVQNKINKLQAIINNEETIIISVGNTQIHMKHVKGGNFKGRVPDLGVDCQRSTAKEWTLYDLSVKDYYIATTEVTQELWEAVMGEPFSEYLQRLPSRVDYLKGSNLSAGGIGGQYPVYYISSDDAKEFIMRLNQLTGKNFRLPTTREWIFAESGGNESLGFIYSGSNDIDKIAWYEGNSNDKTHPVASKLPNELGLYDFSGNVMEWTQCDYLGNTIYGSWYRCEKEGCLLGDNWRAKGHFLGVGFRLAMDYVPKTTRRTLSGYAKTSYTIYK